MEGASTDSFSPRTGGTSGSSRVGNSAVGGAAEEQEEAGFTDKDYSDYNPEEEDAKKADEKSVPAQQVDLADEHNVDEDKLYDE